LLLQISISIVTTKDPLSLSFVQKLVISLADIVFFLGTAVILTNNMLKDSSLLSPIPITSLQPNMIRYHKINILFTVTQRVAHPLEADMIFIFPTTLTKITKVT